MIKNDFYSKESLGAAYRFSLGDFQLSRGGSIKDAQLSYSLHGELNAEANNAILFPVMFSGTHSSLKHYIAAGLALDPERYCIIVPDQLGNGVSSSPHNTPSLNAMSDFPALDIADDVEAQYQLCQSLGITELALVTGWSMGAQQTLEWAVTHPSMVKRAAPIAGTAQCTAHDGLFIDVFTQALRSDPQWNKGNYLASSDVNEGLNRLATVFAMMGLSTQFYKQETWRNLDFGSLEEFISNFWQAWFAPMDANALLAMADKWKQGDCSRPYQNNLNTALKRITAKTSYIAFSEDMFIPVQDCLFEQKLITDSELFVIDSLWGHFAMMGLDKSDFSEINTILSNLLESPC